MKTHVLIYEGFAHFEVVLASYFLKTMGEIITVGISKAPITSGEGYTMLPDAAVGDVDAEAADVLIVPGGDPNLLYDCEALYTLIERLHTQGKVIGAICSGPVHLGKAGVLNGKRFTVASPYKDEEVFSGAGYVRENAVVDGNVITAQASGYVDFALALGKMMNIYEDEADYQETVDFFKLHKMAD